MDENPYQPPKSDISDPASEAVEIREAHISHEASTRAFGILYYFSGVMLGIFGLAQLIIAIDQPSVTLFPFGMGAALIMLCAIFLWIGYGLRRLSSKVRHVAGVLAVIGLSGFPLGTIINAYFLFFKI